MTFRVGDDIPGTKYRVVRELGAGGMGVVYHVVKPPGIEGVLKLMSKDLVATPEFRTRFFDEVRILAKIDHPNVVKVFDYDALPDGTPFYVMELLSGRTLRDALTTNGRLPPRVAFEVTKQLLEALHAAHTHDIPVVHRDIKPENIFLHAPKHGEPRVKLIDFGVIAVADRHHDGMFVGTWRYAAPEQIRGERATPATDLYAVGLLLYEMLSGKGPFDHLETGTDVAQAHLRQVPAPVTKLAPWVPPSVVQLINAALAKDPRGRPRDARAFAERLTDLEHANDGSAAGKAIAPVVQTLQGIGEARKNATAPDEDALLEGLAARPDERVPSKKLRESGRQPLATPSGGGQVVVRVDNDTFASQHSDARGVPKTSSMRIVIAILAATATLLGILLFVVVKNLRSAPPAEPATASAPTTPPAASPAPLPSPSPAPVASEPPPAATSVAAKPTPPVVVHAKPKPSATTATTATTAPTTPRDDFMRGGP